MLSTFLSSKIVLIVATVIGMALCTSGIGRVAERGLWLNPFAILSSVIGAGLLLVVVAALFDIKLPLIDSTQAALIAVVVVVVAKVALTQLHVAVG